MKIYSFIFIVIFIFGCKSEKFIDIDRIKWYTPKQEIEKLNYYPNKFGQFNVKMEYLFKKDMLFMIKLYFIDLNYKDTDSFLKIKGMLSAQYGEPIDGKDKDYGGITWKQKDKAIVLDDFGRIKITFYDSQF